MGLCFYAFLINISNISVLMSYHVPVVTSVNTSGSVNVNEAFFFQFYKKNFFHILKFYKPSDPADCCYDPETLCLLL